MGRSRQTRRKGRSPAQKAALAKLNAAQRQLSSPVDATEREATPEPSPKQAKLDAMRVKFKMSTRRLWKHYQKLAILSMTPEERDRLISSLKAEIERILAELEATQRLLDLQLRRLAKQRARVARLRAALWASRGVLDRAGNTLICRCMRFGSVGRIAPSPKPHVFRALP